MPKNNPDSPQNTPAQGVIAPSLTAGRAALPDDLVGKFELSAWAESLVNNRKYVEPDPDYLSRLLVTQTLMSATPEDIFKQDGVMGLQKAVPNVPDIGTGPIEINDLYIAASDQDDGTPCYMILGCVSLETGEERRYTTGASNLQAQVLAQLSFGVWPIRCNIKRMERKDRGGRYLFWMYPPE